MNQPIGIFDSGIGGLSILKALRAKLPHEDFVYIADSGHVPYGERDDAYVVARSLAVSKYLVGQNIKALVVACNTATAAAIDLLRATYPALPIIGVEPALKPAVSISRTKHIAVMATRSTLASARFAALLAAHSDQARFTLLPCDGLAEAIERSCQSADATELIADCASIISATGLFDTKNKAKTGIDTVVLGCTHYPFVAQYIKQYIAQHTDQHAGLGVRLIDTGAAVAQQTRLRLGRQLAAQRNTATTQFISTGSPIALQAAAKTWLGMTADTKTLLIQ